MRWWWIKLLRYARPSWKTMGVILSLVIVIAAVGAVQPLPMKWLVDRVLKDSNADLRTRLWQAGMLAGATVVIFLVGQLALIARNYLLNGFGNRASYALAAKLFDHLQSLSVMFHTRRAAADLVRRVTTDSACARELLISVVVPVVTSVATLLFMFVVMCRLDWGLALVAMGVVVPLGLLIRASYGPMSRRAAEQQEVESELLTLAERTLSHVPTVQIFGREERGDRAYRDASVRATKAYMATIVAQTQFKIGTGAVTAVGTALAMIFGGRHVMEGKLTLGGLLVFLAYLASLYTPLEALAYVSTTLSATRANAKRVLEVLESGERVVEKADARSVKWSGGVDVRFEGVSFGYEAGREVLRDVCLDVKAGETVALVGPTGAGKSTLVSLIPRLFDPWAGRVVVGGEDISDLRISDLRRAVAVVPQEPVLLPVSVAENIAYGRPDASREEVIAAAEAAHASEFIEKMSAGYDTIIGERGATLSAGQRQRIAIARALLRDAAVLVLDEPTSALDAESEKLVMDALRRLCEGKTCFIIAHRLSTVREAHKVAVLEQGRVVEFGPPRELAHSGGLYQRFLELQALPDEAAVAS
ncbi:MAG TPA: ABC transporter ATP-binding protein [Tepidisphaeraceae bacterium]